jgi:integrase
MAVRRRKWVTSKGEGREAWIVDYTDQDGRHIETFARKKDADARHAEVRVDLRAGVHVAPSKSIRVGEAADLWLQGIEPRIERATLVDYKGHVERHIKPHLGGVKLSDLGRPMVRALEDKLRSKSSEPMVRKVLTTFGTLIADAQERGLVGRNVVHDLLRSRKGKRTNGNRQKEKLKVGVDIPTPTEVGVILAAAQKVAKGRFRPILVVAAFTGLRASELRGLRWSDVDFKKNELHVRQRADRFKAIGRPKSQAGARTVPFGSSVATTLKEWKLRCPKGDLDLVFPNGAGKVEDLVNIVKRGFITAGIAAGITLPVLDAKNKPVLDNDGKPMVKARYSGLHALRHFYASWLINRPEEGGLRLPPKVVQERLGHASITITYDRYGHLFPRGDDAKELDAAELRIVGNAT